VLLGHNNTLNVSQAILGINPSRTNGRVEQDMLFFLFYGKNTISLDKKMRSCYYLIIKFIFFTRPPPPIFIKGFVLAESGGFAERRGAT
jgi:hypothetical protein